MFLTECKFGLTFFAITNNQIDLQMIFFKYLILYAWNIIFNLK